MARTRQAPDKPFRCAICYAKFRSHSSLKSHMAEHSSPRRCSFCGRTERYPGEFCHHNA